MSETVRAQPPFIGWLRSGLQFDSKYQRVTHPAVELAGASALLAYALFWLGYPDISQVMEGVLTGAFLWALWRGPRRTLVRDPFVLMAFAWLVYQFVFVPYVIAEFPNLRSEQVHYARQYAKIGLIPIVAWWLGGSVRGITLLLALAALGFVLGVTFQPGGVLNSTAEISAGKRLGLGYHNWEHVSVYAAFCLIVLVGMSRHIAELFGRLHWIGYLLVGTSIIYCTWIVFITQTRAVWLGLLVGAAAAGAAALLTRPKYSLQARTSPAKSRDGLWMLASVVAVAAILIVALDIPRLIAKRMNEEKHIVSMVMEGDLEQVPLTSIGIRVAIWRQAVNWVGERPLLGWGPKTREYLFESKALPDAIPRMGIRHFHNQILELAIAYGLVGILVFTGLFALVARAALRGWRDGRMPRSVLLFGVATFAFWVTVNMFESYFNYSTGAYINALLGGVLYTFRFTEARA